MINWELVWSAFFLIGAGGFAIILLLLLSVHFQRTHQTKRLELMTYLSIGLTLALLMTFSSVIITSRNEFCANCHEMRPYTESFKKSVHSEMSCYACHGGEGIVGFVISQTGIIREPYLHLTSSYKKPINGVSELSKEMSESICERCHDLTQRKVTARKDIIIDHKKHKEKGIACPICHNRVAHPNPAAYDTEIKRVILPDNLKPAAGFEKERFYPDRMKMRYCMQCHTGESGNDKAPKECKVCHPAKYIKPPKNHKIPGFLRPIPSQAGVTAASYKPLSSKNEALHAQMASIDKEYCQSCHDDKFCLNCHKVGIPHPKARWQKEHGKIGEASPDKCQSCHGELNFCDKCHHEYDPNKGPWYSRVPKTSYHPIMVKERGAEPCFDCHKPTYCAHCHVTGNP